MKSKISKKALLTLAMLSGFSYQAFAVEFSAGLINDTSNVVSGGLHERTTSRTLGMVGVEQSITEQWLFHADAMILRGRNGSDDVGDIQAYSNIDETRFSKIFEVWVEGNFDSLNLRTKVGRVDANSEFAFVEHGGEFINSSMGFSPSIAFMPTYPTPTPAANVFYSQGDSTVAVGAYSSDHNDFAHPFYIAEWQQGLGDVELKLGVWHQTGQLERLDNGLTKHGSTGFYATLEGDADIAIFNASRAGWFVQLGHSDDKIAEIDNHVGAGLVWYGTFSRADDVMGIGITHVTTSDYLHADLQSSETAIESYHRFQLTEHIALKPDVQYIINPAADRLADDAFVITLRTEISL